MYVQRYGMTELSPVASIGTTRISKMSVGYLVANTQMKVVSINDNPGRNLGPNEIGELYFRGPQVMKGYYKNAQATADIMDGDWLKTGDLGYYSENGKRANCTFFTGKTVQDKLVRSEN